MDTEVHVPDYTQAPSTMSSASLRMDNVYRIYSKEQEPAKDFAKCKEWIEVLRKSPKHGIKQKHFNDTTIRCIYSSNRIEGVGLGLADTNDICKRMILHNENMPIIDNGIPKHREHLQRMFAARKDKTSLIIATPEAFNHGRTEVINHVKAYQYMLDQVVCQEQPLSEELILKTHRILCSDTPIYSKPDKNGAIVVTPGPEYAGCYRTVHVSAGTTNFASPKYVPRMMARLAEDIAAAMNHASTCTTTDSNETQAGGAGIDPFAMAAKYSYHFVQIHPFRDGNGRMCRIILNTILYKYTGIVVPIGETAEDQEEYIRIKRRRGSKAADHSEYAVFVLRKASVGLRDVTKKLRA